MTRQDNQEVPIVNTTERHGFLKSAGIGALALSIRPRHVRAVDAHEPLAVGV